MGFWDRVKSGYIKKMQKDALKKVFNLGKKKKQTFSEQIEKEKKIKEREAVEKQEAFKKSKEVAKIEEVILINIHPDFFRSEELWQQAQEIKQQIEEYSKTLPKESQMKIGKFLFMRIFTFAKGDQQILLQFFGQEVTIAHLKWLYDKRNVKEVNQIVELQKAADAQRRS